MELTLVNPHLSSTVLPGSNNGLSNVVVPFMFTEACSAVTPLHPTIWKRYLTKHPNRQLAEFFLQGLSEGFRIVFDYASPIALESAKTNIENARLYAEVVDDYLQTKISLGRVASPFF